MHPPCHEGLAHPLPERTGMTGITRTGEALRDLVAHVMGMARWSLSSVDVDKEPHVVPMPGPAHGPVPAIQLRLKDQREASAKHAA